MRLNPVKAVIFDLGNVLIDFDHRIAADAISKFTDKTIKQIFNLIFDSSLIELFEEGKITPFDFFSRLKGLLGLKIDYDEFLPIWNEIFFITEKNIEVYNLAHVLKKRYRVALLTNINILHFEYIKKTFPILDAFHNIVTSFEAGFRKPKSRIYQKTLEILKVSPDEAFYTDDRPELVESARGLGIRGFVFHGVEKLRKDLSASGININPAPF